jgi:glycosyltransferase involved in cell wall biosynthesis
MIQANPTLDSLDNRIGTLNIAIVSDAAPARNGVGTFYVDLTKHLKKFVNRIEILSPTVVDDKWKAGLVLPLPGDKTQKLCFPNPFSLRRQLQDIDPDLVLIATPGVYGLFGAMLAARMGIPAIAGFHTSFEKITELYWKHSAAGKIVQGYFKVSNNYLFKKCPLVLANSEEMILQAERMGAKQTRLITTPVSATFTDHPVREHSGELKRVLFAGRMAPEKNLEAVIEAAKALPDMQFTLAGEGPLRNQMEAEAATLDNLRCLGWCSREQIREQIDQHDALILPSHFESFGTIALEAMTRKKLVIVSTHCGILDWSALQPGLHVMQGNKLADKLGELASLTNSERITLAEKAHSVSLGANNTCLNDWFQLLLENARAR